LIEGSPRPEKLAPVHPGEVLQGDFLTPLGLSQTQLALAIRVLPNRINAIVRGQRGISADTALRLARYLGTSPELWLGLQADSDLEVAQDALGDALEREITPLPRAVA